MYLQDRVDECELRARTLGVDLRRLTTRRENTARKYFGDALTGPRREPPAPGGYAESNVNDPIPLNGERVLNVIARALGGTIN